VVVSELLEDGRGQGSTRNDSGHDSLVVAKQKHAQRYEHTGKIAVGVHQLRCLPSCFRRSHQLLSMQPVDAGGAIARSHDGCKYPVRLGYATRAWIRYLNILLTECSPSGLLSDVVLA
jgi:hypothetical protein